MRSEAAFDVLVVGGGPAGQKAAVQAAKAKRKVLLVDDAAGIGGECVRRGTIPSKTLRETAIAFRSLRLRTGQALPFAWREGQELESLMSRVSQVVQAHVELIDHQLTRNGITLWKGRAEFVNEKVMEVRSPGGPSRLARGEIVFLAPGSRPRTPPNVPIDHDVVLDSDSFLSMTYLPRTLTVLGSGVIATEYASIFATLGTEVTMIDRAPRPLSFLDADLVRHFLRAFEASGGRFLGGQAVPRVEANGFDGATVTLEDGSELRSERLLCALGRVANTHGLKLDRTGLELDAKGFIPVDENCQTSVPGIYAIGDVIGPPALASASMEQGRRAARHALHLPLCKSDAFSPMAIYAVPEMASVGMNEVAARERFGRVLVGRAEFREIARGQISAAQEGFLKLVAKEDGTLLGAQIVGENAAELIHLAQVALIGGLSLDTFVDNTFNFPTLAEAYRVAALSAAAS